MAQPGYVDPSWGLASRWARLGAILLDGLILAPVTVPIVVLLTDWDRIFDPQPGQSAVDTGQLLGQLITTVLAFFYMWLMTATRGQSLGKMIVGIRVVNADTGEALTYGQAAGREAFRYFLGAACACVSVLDSLWILWDLRKQCLHDKVIRSVVVKVDRSLPDPYASR